MRISDRRRLLLSHAISEPIMDLRIELAGRGLPAGETVDSRLFDLEVKIYDTVWKALGIEEEE